MEYNTFTFTAPSGYTYTIREENGADEEIISNQAAARTFMNFSNFLSAIVVSTDFTDNKVLSPKDALDLPLLDRYAILIKSRIFSLGNMLEFSYTWPGDVVPIHYEQDLEELVLSNYKEVDLKELESKPEAIKPYENTVLKAIKYKDYQVTLSTGKVISFNFADGNMERYSAMLPEDKQTRNSELLARGLKLKVGDKFETVQEFSLFTIKEMAEIRSIINKLDPIYAGLIDIENPRTGEVTKFSVFQAPRFFFLTEA